jgi:hypothetical protein
VTIILRNACTNDSTTQPAACAACGGDFSCGAALEGCWCTELKLSDEKLAELSVRYAGCLCRECLQSFASEQTPYEPVATQAQYLDHSSHEERSHAKETK